MQTQSKIKNENRKSILVAICVLTAGWLAMTANAEDKQSKNKPKVQPAISEAVSPAVNLETKGSVKQTKPVFFPALTKRELKIQEALNEDTECNFADLPLSEVVATFSERHEITFILLSNDLGEEGLTEDEPVSFNVKGIALKDALGLILEPIGLTYVVDRGVVIITTIVKTDEKYKTRVYPVGDFGNTPEVYLELISTIENDNLGTIGTISPVSSSKSLVIRQTYHGHNAIVELLTQLRQARALE